MKMKKKKKKRTEPGEETRGEERRGEERRELSYCSPKPSVSSMARVTFSTKVSYDR